MLNAQRIVKGTQKIIWIKNEFKDEKTMRILKVEVWNLIKEVRKKCKKLLGSLLEVKEEQYEKMKMKECSIL